MTRRAALGAAAAAGLAAGCSSGPEKPPVPAPPDPQAVLLASLISGKEELVSLYGSAAAALPDRAAALEPFRQRHSAHLEALRALLRNVTGTFPARPSASPSAPVSGTPSAVSAVSVETLRDAERRAAAARPAQTATASPALSQLLASIGACEAVHVVALGRLRD